MDGVFFMDHKMMSICLRDANFYEVAPVFKSVQSAAQREWESRKGIIEAAAKASCSSCGKKSADKARVELEKRHGAIFSQLISSTRAHDPNYQFAGLHEYVKTHMEALTGGRCSGAPFRAIAVYVPVGGANGSIEVARMEI